MKPVKYMTLLLTGLALILLEGCKNRAEVQAPPARPAKFFTVKSVDEIAARRYPAVVEANEKAALSFRIGGTIVEFNVRIGQEVKKGDLIARLDARDYELALSRANIQLQETQAQERAMKSARPEDIEILERKLAAAKSQFDRDEIFYKQRDGLVEKGVISREELQSAEAAYRTSKANLEAAKQELEKGKAGARKEEVEAIQARIKDLKESVRNAENALSDTQLKAPYTARIVDKLVDTYQEVKMTQPVVNVQQIDVIKLNFGLPETVMFNLESNNPGTFGAVFIGLPEKEYPVKLNEFRLAADDKTRTFSCWVTMPAPEGSIVLPGMTAEIIHHNPRATRPGFLVPSSALSADETKTFFVWKINPADMTVSKTPVETGPLSGESVWVNKGLKEGEIIVAAGVNYLTEGMKLCALDPKE